MLKGVAGFGVGVDVGLSFGRIQVHY